MEIRRAGSQPSAKGPQTGSLAAFGFIHCFRRPIRHQAQSAVDKDLKGKLLDWMERVKQQE